MFLPETHKGGREERYDGESGGGGGGGGGGGLGLNNIF